MKRTELLSTAAWPPLRPWYRNIRFDPKSTTIDLGATQEFISLAIERTRAAQAARPRLVRVLDFSFASEPMARFDLQARDLTTLL